MKLKLNLSGKNLYYDIYAKKIKLDEDSIDQEIENIKKKSLQLCNSNYQKLKYLYHLQIIKKIKLMI